MKVFGLHASIYGAAPEPSHYLDPDSRSEAFTNPIKQVRGNEIANWNSMAGTVNRLCGPRHPINSKGYWDDRFRGDWQAHEGRAQTAFFAHVALSASPAWLLDEIRDRRLSICDWGCAIGDAARDLARVFPTSDVAGYDISETAIAEGRRLFPGLELVAGDLLADERQFDVVFSSNTLEHFPDPDAILTRLGLRARDFLWLLVPFQDPGGIEEHFVRFDHMNIRPHLDDAFVLAFFNNVDVSDWPGTQWAGRQAILVYARPAALARIAARGCEVSAPAYREAFVSPSPEVATSRLASCMLRLNSVLERQRETEISAALVEARATETAQTMAASLAAAETARMEAEAKSARALAAAEEARAEIEAASARALAAADAARAEVEAASVRTLAAAAEAARTAERERVVRDELAEAWHDLRTLDAKIVESHGRCAVAEDRAIRAEHGIREAETRTTRIELELWQAEARAEALEAATSSALVLLAELRRGKAWRLARLARYARAEVWNGGLPGIVRGSGHVLHRSIRPGKVLPAHDHLNDVIRVLEEPLVRSGHPPVAPVMLPVPSVSPESFGVGAARGERNLVSIVMPVYNHADLLPEAIAGILAQTHRNWELIVVDDGSGDGFNAAISPFFHDPRIRVFSQANQRLPAALNNGFRHARGEYLTWTSADNVMLPQQLERLVAALEADAGAGLAFSDYEAIDDRGAPLLDPHWRAHNRPDCSALVRLPREVTVENFHDSGDNFLGASFLYRADVAAVVGGYDNAAFGGEDYDFWLRMHLVTRFRHVDEVLYRYRVHDNTLSAKAKELDLASNIRALRNADRERRGALLADGGSAPSGDKPWRDPTQVQGWCSNRRTNAVLLVYCG